MLIGIISDFHLGHKNVDAKIYENVVNELQNKYNVDEIVDCGDLVDKCNIDSVISYNLYEMFLSVKIPFHILRGNHDSLSGLSITQLLAYNSNIKVYNDVGYSASLNAIFVPYTDNLKETYDKITNVIKQFNNGKPTKLAFSHINVTSNFYSTINIKNTEQLHVFADTWFNGHIHTPEENKSMYGNFYNVGSLSSLTYGDEHIPSYKIYNTDTNELTTIKLKNCLIHKTVNYDFDFESFIREYDEYLIDWRIKIPNKDLYVDLRQKIKENLQKHKQTHNIQFDYIKDTTAAENNTDINTLSSDSNNNNSNKLSLMEQLILQYENDTKIQLSDCVKNLLLQKEIV